MSFLLLCRVSLKRLGGKQNFFLIYQTETGPIIVIVLFFFILTRAQISHKQRFKGSKVKVDKTVSP